MNPHILTVDALTIASLVSSALDCAHAAAYEEPAIVADAIPSILALADCQTEPDAERILRTIASALQGSPLAVTPPEALTAAQAIASAVAKGEPVDSRDALIVARYVIGRTAGGADALRMLDSVTPALIPGEVST